MTELLSMKYSELQITSENPTIWVFVVVLVVVVFVPGFHFHKEGIETKYRHRLIFVQPSNLKTIFFFLPVSVQSFQNKGMGNFLNTIHKPQPEWLRG